ncbi:MAG: hypothetical protein M3P26_04180 [Gemmatimonadota bacterium]|nr:hypothetical protein [Gemmatimonadota bacterium]
MPGEPTAQLIQDELEAEREWKRSLEQRALTLLGAAGVIGSLAGVSARGSGLPDGTRVLLVLSLGALGIGVGFALSVAYPVLVPGVSRVSLAKALQDDGWNDATEENLRLASRARLNILGYARDANEKKALRLRLALWAVGVGIALLLTGVIVALIVGPHL